MRNEKILKSFKQNKHLKVLQVGIYVEALRDANA